MNDETIWAELRAALPDLSEVEQQALAAYHTARQALADLAAPQRQGIDPAAQIAAAEACTAQVDAAHAAWQAAQNRLERAAVRQIAQWIERGLARLAVHGDGEPERLLRFARLLVRLIEIER